jgi:hypothetical protein
MPKASIFKLKLGGNLLADLLGSLVLRYMCLHVRNTQGNMHHMHKDDYVRLRFLVRQAHRQRIQSLLMEWDLNV